MLALAFVALQLPAAEVPSALNDLELGSYRATAALNEVEQLNQRVQAGEKVPEYSEAHGYLPFLLRELKIPASSQILVASKTSPNKHHISPTNPRALYFGDTASLAYVPGAELIELLIADSKLGTAFYTLEQKHVARPTLRRDDRCLECHATSKTLNAPGWLVRSFVTQGDGEVDVLSGMLVTHRTPIQERWGGYFVTGAPKELVHRGNAFGLDSSLKRTLPSEGGNSNADLAKCIQVRRYPAGTSDVRALLVFDHQVHMLNLMGRLRIDAQTIREDEEFNRAHAASEAVLRYLLFVGEAPLQAGLRERTEFARWFEAAGPADPLGRSLRQFDLEKRLFKYRCSYLIHSDAFAALPARARKHLYRRLWQVLTGEDASLEWKDFSRVERDAIREILAQTQKDLPEYWKL